MTPETYLRYLQQKAYNSNFKLALNTIDPRSEEGLARIRRAKSVLRPDATELSEAELSGFENLANRPLWNRLDPFVEKFRKQSLEAVATQDVERLKKTAVGFLPTGVINACCVGGLSGGYVVAINTGLYYTCVLLSIALSAPDTTGELLQDALESVYPEEILEASINCAIKPSAENYETLERHHSYMTPELLGLGAAGAWFILWFIFLHEAGHICGGDVDKSRALAIFDFENQKIDYIKANFQREYAADRFALNACLGQLHDPVSVWAQFSNIETLFLFLNYVERTKKLTSSQTHPPAIERLRRLRKIIEKKWGKDELGYAKAVGVRLNRMRKA